jgi:hypothetical protein
MPSSGLAAGGFGRHADQYHHLESDAAFRLREFARYVGQRLDPVTDYIY